MVSAAVGVVAAGWGIGRFTMAAAEDTSRCVSDVVERDLSCRTRIKSSLNSPGVLRKTGAYVGKHFEARMDTAHEKIFVKSL